VVIDHREITELFGQEPMPIYSERLNPPLRHFATDATNRLWVLSSRPKVEDRDPLQLRALAGGSR
jgi:hypothetical protein